MTQNIYRSENLCWVVRFDWYRRAVQVGVPGVKLDVFALELGARQTFLGVIDLVALESVDFAWVLGTCLGVMNMFALEPGDFPQMLRTRQDSSSATDVVALVTYTHRVPDYVVALVIDYRCFLRSNALVAELQKGDPTHALIPIFGCVDAILLSERWVHESSLDLCRLRSSSTNVRHHIHVDLSSCLLPGVLAAPLAGLKIHSVEGQIYEYSMRPSGH